MATINGVILQYFHWYSPADGSLWNELKENAKHLADAGFTALWLPPVYKGNSGGLDVGYAVYDTYDLGELNQKGSVRTKYGTKDELLAAVEKAKQAGLQLYWDVTPASSMRTITERVTLTRDAMETNTQLIWLAIASRSTTS